MNEAREPGKPLVGLSKTPAGSEVNPPNGGTNLIKKTLIATIPIFDNYQ